MNVNNILDFDDLPSTAISNERENYVSGRGEFYDITFIICFIVIILVILSLFFVSVYHKIKKN